MPVYFERGFVFKGNIPEPKLTSLTPPPSFILYGEHRLIVLHSSDFPDIDPRMALVIPITSAKAEKKRAQKEGRFIRASYVPIPKDGHPFLEHDSYASTAQICPVNREWLNQYVGTIRPELMNQIDMQVILNIGAMNTVVQLAQKLYEKRPHQQEETAAGNE